MNAPKGEETIFAEALRLPANERAAYVAQATQGNTVLRQRIESLLLSYGDGEFLEEAAAPHLGQTCHVTVPVTEKSGDTIGRYKLLQQIGEGGCGVVYVAEQCEPVRRRVALKIIKLGMDTRSIIARFEAERQALAMMDHPNIAKVFDAGATDAPIAQPGSSGRESAHASPDESQSRLTSAATIGVGRPYFVMELVRGTKITEFCDEAKLTTRARLELFIQVCQAIQHAHQKGIIHRDIKPSNVLVSMNDGVPVPKVIDFGIAKATSGLQLTDKTIYTAFEQFIGTPAYMSPEQAVITNVDIDTRSDIYALGVLLYELLTGRTPFDAKDLLAAGLDEMRRTIRDQEPPRPSTRLSTLPGQELNTTAQCRSLDAPKLVSELRGDLDWIVMKALEKDRARRYETANGLAADIQRHLNNEPVVACPPSRLYRLRKTVRRNRLAFSAAASVVAALAIGLAISTWRFVKEREALKRAVAAEQAATAEKESAEAVLQFVRDKILAAGRPEGMGGGVGKDVTLRQAIDAAESRIALAFTNRPLVEASLRKTLGESYIYLGDPLLAIPQLERALALRREGLGLENEHTVGAMTLLRQAYRDAGKPFEFVPFYQQAFELTKAKWGPDHTNTLSVMSDLALAYRDAEKFDEAIQMFNEMLNLRKAKLGPDHDDTLKSMGDLAWTYQDARKYDQAISLYEQALKLLTAKRGPEHDDTLAAMNNLAVVHGQTGKLDKARELFEQALQLKEKTKPEHHGTLLTMCNLAGAYKDAGKFDQAISLFRKAFKLRMATLGPEHAETLRVMTGLAGTYAEAKKFDDAFPLYEKALELRTATLGRTNRLTLDLMNELGFAYGYDTTGKQLDKAIPLFEETLTLRRAELGSNHVDTVISMDNLARAYAWAGRFDEALSLLHEIESGQGLDHPGTLHLMNSIGVRYVGGGKLDQALALWEQTYQRAKRSPGLGQAATDLFARNLASAYRSAGKLDQLEALYRGQLPQHTGPGRTVRFDLGKLLLELAKTDSTDPARRQDLANEGEQLVREYLAGVRIRYTNDPVKLDEKLSDVAEFRYRQGSYAQAEPIYREIVQKRRDRLSAGHKDVLDATASLARLLSDRAWAERTNSQPSTSALQKTNQSLVTAAATTPHERAQEAERLLREVVPLRLRDSTSSSRIGDWNSRLGGALVSVAATDPTMDAPGRESKFREAESLLIESFQRLENSSTTEKYMRDALERIDRLYEAWGKPDKRSEWRNLLTAGEAAQLTLSLLQQEKFAEAEARARVCLAIREKQVPDDWRTFNARSMLGDSLLGQKKYADAEPLLLSGYEGLKQRQTQIPAAGKPRIREALERVVHLYEATGRDIQVTEWKNKLAEFDQPKAQAKAK